MNDQLKDVKHDYIRYANCWEDADVLLKGLDMKSGDRVLSIASAGDNCLSLLIADPEIVVAVDINPCQLYLLELKMAAITELEYEVFLQFMGFKESNYRGLMYDSIKQKMSPEAVIYWDFKRSDIEVGVIFQGKFENYFRIFRKKILPLIHSEKRINSLFEKKNTDAQLAFFKHKWNNRRWRILFKVFFSRFVMGKLGRDPKFLNEVDGSVSTLILTQADNYLSTVDCQNNYFLQYILLGKYKTELPHYARRENYEKIKNNIDRIEISNGLIEEVFKEYGNFDKYNLSNIFEYMDHSLFRKVAIDIIENGNKGSRYAYWNLMVTRQMSKISEMVVKDEKSEQWARLDNGFFYKSFNVDMKL